MESNFFYFEMSPTMTLCAWIFTWCRQGSSTTRSPGGRFSELDPGGHRDAKSNRAVSCSRRSGAGLSGSLSIAAQRCREAQPTAPTTVLHHGGVLVYELGSQSAQHEVHGRAYRPT